MACACGKKKKSLGPHYNSYSTDCGCSSDSPTVGVVARANVILETDDGEAKLLSGYETLMCESCADALIQNGAPIWKRAS